MDNAIGLISQYQTKAQGKKSQYTQKKGTAEASKLYGMDLANKNESATKILDKQ